MKITQESIDDGTADWDNQMDEILEFIKSSPTTNEDIVTFDDFFVESYYYKKFKDMTLNEISEYGSLNDITKLKDEFTIISAYITNRYCNWNEKGWTSNILTKNEWYNQNKNIKSDDMKTEMFEFQYDDIVILAKYKNAFLFIWMDCDVSDCSLGIFNTTLNEQKVKMYFKSHLESIKISQPDNATMSDVKVKKFNIIDNLLILK